MSTEREQNGLYELELTFNQVAYISTSSAFYYHYRLGHPSLPTLKFLVLNLSYVSSLECESCQLEKHHHVSYANRVNKRTDKPFDLVHYDVWNTCSLPSELKFRFF